MPPHELYVMSSPCPFVDWGMDVVGPIEPSASNGHRFIMVAIDCFTMWVETASYRAVTKKVIADFIKNNLICRFGVSELIITNYGANLNSHLMNEICDQFTIIHCNSTSYRPQMNRAVKAANKNIKKILRKMGNEAVIPVEVEMPSLRIISEVELSNEEWVQARYEQLILIDEKRMVVVFHGWLYQHRIVRAFNKKVKAQTFEAGPLVQKCIFRHQEEYKDKFAPNWQGPYIVRKVLYGGARDGRSRVDQTHQF
ncbi:uncharacterized protein LOC124885877 [Capsicum annuum]|uniref:uncharacterized protein LOC124885877 n=1 Tax=Capsicum annuum TaxID=4072 RepID=UPI001FB07426|nr:uncharacterized protein LOC124885877 [Capsicum annuum]